MKKIIISIFFCVFSFSGFTQVRMVLRAPFYFDQQNGSDINPKSISALSFYQGLRLALDDLSQKGLEIKLDVIDEVLNEDSIFPLKPWTEIELVLSKEGKLYIFTGKKNGALQIEMNANMRDHFSEIADYLFQIPGKKNLVFLNRNKAQERKILEIWRDEMKVAGFDSIPEIVKSDFLYHPFEASLKKGFVNYILIPSADQGFVSNALQRIKKIPENYTVVVVGLPNWMNFSSIDAEAFEKAQLIYSSEKFIDYNGERQLWFRNLYQKKYFSDPIDFAFKGYDVGFFCGNLLLKYPTDFDLHISEPILNRLVTNFSIVLDESNKYHNKAVQLIQITPHGISRRNR